MRQWIGTALIQIIACHLFGAKPLYKPIKCWFIANWTLRDKLQWNFNQNTKLFIHENASENIVCEMAAILSRGRRVNNEARILVWGKGTKFWRKQQMAQRPDGKKIILHEPMLTSRYWGSVASTWEQFHSKCPRSLFCIMALKVALLLIHLPRVNGG